MPLLPGKKNIGHNVTVEERAGKPKKQAVAIALHKAGKDSEPKFTHPDSQGKLPKIHAQLMKKGYKYGFPFPNKEGTMTRHSYLHPTEPQKYINERKNGYHNITGDSKAKDDHEEEGFEHEGSSGKHSRRPEDDSAEEILPVKTKDGEPEHHADEEAINNRAVQPVRVRDRKVKDKKVKDKKFTSKDLQPVPIKKGVNVAPMVKTKPVSKTAKDVEPIPTKKPFHSLVFKSQEEQNEAYRPRTKEELKKAFGKDIKIARRK